MATPLPPTPKRGSVTGYLGSWDSWVPGSWVHGSLSVWVPGVLEAAAAAGGCWRLLEAAGGLEAAFPLVFHKFENVQGRIFRLTGFQKRPEKRRKPTETTETNGEGHRGRRRFTAADGD